MRLLYPLIGLLLISMFLVGCGSDKTDDVADDLGMDAADGGLVDLPSLDAPTGDIDVGLDEPDAKLIELGELV